MTNFESGLEESFFLTFETIPARIKVGLGLTVDKMDTLRSQNYREEVRYSILVFLSYFYFSLLILYIFALSLFTLFLHFFMRLNKKNKFF